MYSFLLSSFSLMALIIMLTASLFLVSLFRISNKADYKKWLILYFSGLLIWHSMGFISGGLHGEARELTYRYTNLIFNAGLAITCYSLVQLAYLFPVKGFETERKWISRILLVVCAAYVLLIFWFHFIRSQEGLSSFTYGKFVNPLAGVFSLLLNGWVFFTFIRKSIYFKKQGSPNRVPARFLALCTILTILISILFIYPGAATPFVLPVYIYGVWILIQAQVLIFIIYSVFPVRFQDKLVGFTFASIMAILSVTTMVIVSFTTNSDNEANILQRIEDQETLRKLLWIILSSAIFILWIYPVILRISLIQPLQRLMAGIQKAEEGDLNVEVKHGMLDEIGIVTRNFNEMVKSLKTSNDKLSEYANTLEQKVADRTTELTHSMEELKATQSQLIQSEKMASLGELTAGIAHEIQNPLNFVNNFSEVSNELISEMMEEIKKGNTEEAKKIVQDLQHNLEKILHHGKRADAIVKGMLQHSRTSSGQKESANINTLAEEYLRLAYHGLRAKDKNFNATLKTDFDESIGNISIIPQDVGRVILNLITNAFYAVNEKKQQPINGYDPTVSVTTKNLNEHVEIIVKDNGMGISPQAISKIFQPFFTTKPAGQGTGLGLSMSYDIIVKGHGGELIPVSEEGIGTSFIIRLPNKLNQKQ